MNIPRYDLPVGEVDAIEQPDGKWCFWEDVEKALKAAEEKTKADFYRRQDEPFTRLIVSASRRF